MVPPDPRLPPDPSTIPLPPLELAEPPVVPDAALVAPPWPEFASPLVPEQAHNEDAATAINRIFFMGCSFSEVMGKAREGIVDTVQIWRAIVAGYGVLAHRNPKL